MEKIAAYRQAQRETAGQRSESRLTMVRVRALLAARILLASVFLLSGILKLHSPGGASAFLGDIFPLSPQIARVMVIALSLTEVGVACLLLLNRWVATLSLLSSVFLLASTFVAVLFISEPINCGCFGVFGHSRTDVCLLIRNFSLLILSMSMMKASAKSGVTDSTK